MSTFHCFLTVLTLIWDACCYSLIPRESGKKWLKQQLFLGQSQAKSCTNVLGLALALKLQLSYPTYDHMGSPT